MVILQVRAQLLQKFRFLQKRSCSVSVAILKSLHLKTLLKEVFRYTIKQWFQ